jgi:hypothetical protein
MSKKKKLLFMATFTSAIPSLWDAPIVWTMEPLDMQF